MISEVDVHCHHVYISSGSWYLSLKKYFGAMHLTILIFPAEKVLRHEDLRGAPLLILANKQVKHWFCSSLFFCWNHQQVSFAFISYICIWLTNTRFLDECNTIDLLVSCISHVIGIDIKIVIISVAAGSSWTCFSGGTS